MKDVHCALTIAGTDPSGGAGIQADLKTFQELKSYGMSVLTSIVSQNTTGVKDVHHLPETFLKSQLEAVSEDMPIHALKTGMVASKPMMNVISQWLETVDCPYVMDPVMVAQSGDPLMNKEDQRYLQEYLIPKTSLVTPNLPETEVLVGGKVETKEEMKEAAKVIVEELRAGAALVKGGHLNGRAVDMLYDGKNYYEYDSERIDSSNTHGTGCTYSAAITAYLSQGHSLPEAVEEAKYFVTEAIRHSFDLGKGNGPTNHFALREEVLNRWL
ncbi:bifunctional hydroxymethylpyrimidine kinase/phosphomethylpyrimidine kinase [Halobacillus karajensis]|uniref:Hydroxymethylpyrimidine/phosphomethylpyrimidine kinase n=1 Tax=Halobacillus karajensis TaxID=195088 RepID=A0A059NYL7_9BACI|nr:bifunctional hydroxymethylpyrimidine kinase/phosphomethylpyrimidine kinase [Halobacillus karajensis]CDQ18617.1 Hydroxymethylpyrimidine/phosphomethylpyrimidine kinase [Halobacillus karajensis]CDQ23311.1 Hydroxymethylpyrimidine/phosphomethylpyrimidine kinase [Halobacillus karajensis]CDQ26793.1 Hydroxymethylpyrimidine/phosphomethylpyrimidine kinase [Halobacillus karajensis]